MTGAQWVFAEGQDMGEPVKELVLSLEVGGSYCPTFLIPRSELLSNDLFIHPAILKGLDKS